MSPTVDKDDTTEIKKVIVTPDMALDWLAANENNRTVSRKHVQMLAGLMAAKRFHFVADPIRFDTAGRLLDGQHRLHAIIESEMAQKMVVVTGLPPESQAYMDAGRKRSPGDQLAVALGMRNANQAAAIVRTYIQWRDGVFMSETRKIDIPEIVDWADSNEDLLVDATTRSRRMTTARVPTSVAVCGAVYIAANKISPDDAADFWAGLADGAGLDEGNPILTLRNAIIRRHDRERWTRVEEWAYYTRAWNLWRKGVDLFKLQGWRGSITLENLRLK